MAYNNNIYGNAAFCGFITGMLAGRNSLKSAVAADYNALRAAAIAMAVDVDAAIAADPLVSTTAAITQLDSNKVLMTALAAAADFAAFKAAGPGLAAPNLIAANQMWRAGILRDLCWAGGQGLYTLDATVAGSGARQAQVVAAVVAAWTSALAGLVTP